MTTAVEFDFSTKQERTIPVEDVAASCSDGKYCWIDLDATTDYEGAESLLRNLGLDGRAVEDALALDECQFAIYDNCLHLDVAVAWFEHGKLVISHVDALIGRRVFVTIRRGPVEFIQQIHRTYRRDFLEFARTPSFLLYEFWDHLIDSYRKADRRMAIQVREVQDQVFQDVDDAIFNHVAETSRDLLALRKTILEAREVLGELTVRRCAYVSETTLPALEQMIGTVDRVADDLAVEREMLSETLHLYMGVVSHRTNRVLSRLTALSMIFLPLTFLCGIYGMNFDEFPELHWKLGYPMFWGISALIVTGLLVAMRIKKWL